MDTEAVTESCLPPMILAGNLLPLLITLTARIFKNLSKTDETTLVLFCKDGIDIRAVGIK